MRFEILIDRRHRHVEHFGIGIIVRVFIDRRRIPMRARPMHPQLAAVRRQPDGRDLHAIEMKRLLDIAQVLGQLRLRFERNDLRTVAKTVMQPITVFAAMRADVEHRTAYQRAAPAQI